MVKLSLVIADTDSDYVKSLEQYLMLNYPQRFDISSLTAPGYLEGFLAGQNRKVNVLLLGEGFERGALGKLDYDTALRLSKSAGNLSVCEEGTDENGLETVSKYQHAEKLVSDIYRIFSKREGAGLFSPASRKVTVVSVFSPSGGCGKSSIAACCSILCAEKGLKVFYLNLESVPSTTLYFKGESCQSFSNAIYHLKERDGNIAVRLEGARCADPGTGVHFFLPPESSVEMDSLTGEELGRLVAGFMTAAHYDVVFMDLQGGLTQENIALLDASDTVIQVYAPDSVSRHKARLLRTEQEILGRKYSLDLAGKSVFVLNRCCSGEDADTDEVFQYRIPECTGMRLACEGGRPVCMETSFASAVDKLLADVIPDYRVTGRAS